MLNRDHKENQNITLGTAVSVLAHGLENTIFLLVADVMHNSAQP